VVGALKNHSEDSVFDALISISAHIRVMIASFVPSAALMGPRSNAVASLRSLNKQQRSLAWGGQRSVEVLPLFGGQTEMLAIA
jgi:hypothetical protein